MVYSGYYKYSLTALQLGSFNNLIKPMNNETQQEELSTELLSFRDNEEITSIDKLPSGYNFIATSGHGYLAIPTGDYFYSLAKKIVNYGYIGKLAIYLEEDNEALEFLNDCKQFGKNVVNQT